MKNNSTIWLIIIAVLLIIILGLTASIASIFFAKNRIERGGYNRPPMPPGQLNTYEAPSGQWSLEYPKNWYTSEEPDEDFVIIKNEPFSQKLADPDSIRISRDQNAHIDEMIDLLKQSLDYKEEKVTVDGLIGTKIDGTVKEGAESMYPPGTRMVEYFFELSDNDVLNISTNSDFYANALPEIVASMKFDLQLANKFDATKSDTQVVSDSENVKVYEPLPGDKISSPFILRGEAIAFEATVNYTLLDDEGNELATGYMTAVGPDIGQYGEFTKPITFSTTAKAGILEVYTLSARDGSKQDLVQIVVEF